MEVPIIVKLNRLNWKEKQMHRTKWLRIEMYRTKDKKTELEVLEIKRHRTKRQGTQANT